MIVNGLISLFKCNNGKPVVTLIQVCWYDNTLKSSDLIV